MELYKIDSLRLQKQYHLRQDRASIHISFGRDQEHRQQINLSWDLKSRAPRAFFVCPFCGKRVRYLYRIPGDLLYKCTDCAGINQYRGIQNMTKGGADEIAYRMRRYADLHGITFNLPFDYLDYLQDPRAGQEDFAEQLKVLQAMENMRFGAVFFGKKYKAAVFRSVINGTHHLMQACTTADLLKYVYDWNKGKGIANNERLQI